MFEKKENKIHKIKIRFTESERKAIENYVEDNNFKSSSEFIRYLLAREFKDIEQ